MGTQRRQLPVPADGGGSDQPESTSNVTVTVLSLSRRKVRKWGEEATVGGIPTPVAWPFRSPPDSFHSLPEYCLVPRKVGR